jgi:hypothetical protein
MYDRSAHAKSIVAITIRRKMGSTNANSTRL